MSWCKTSHPPYSLFLCGQPPFSAVTYDPKKSAVGQNKASWDKFDPVGVFFVPSLWLKGWRWQAAWKGQKLLSTIADYGINFFAYNFRKVTGQSVRYWALRIFTFYTAIGGRMQCESHEIMKKRRHTLFPPPQKWLIHELVTSSQNKANVWC